MGTVDFETNNVGVPLLVWSVIRKSSVEALMKLRMFMNICNEVIKNYEQLWSTISKFQALFSTIRAPFEHFFCHVLITFWRIFQQPRPQGAFPWLSRPASKAREKRPGNEVDFPAQTCLVIETTYRGKGRTVAFLALYQQTRTETLSTRKCSLLNTFFTLHFTFYFIVF